MRGGVSGDAHERALDCGEQIEGGGRIITRRLGQRVDTDHAGLIDAKVELPPATPAAATVFRGGPLTCPDDGQTRAVEHEMDALAGRDRSQTAPQMLTAPGERRIVGGGEVEALPRTPPRVASGAGGGPDLGRGGRPETDAPHGISGR